MAFSFEPQLIKQDSAVPLRMMTGGWAAGVVTILVAGPVANRVIALMGISLIAGGLIALQLRGTRMWRMVLGASTGAVAAWLGFRFALSDRLLRVVDDPLQLSDTDLLAAIGLGLCVLAIGVGGVLEAVRAQSAPGSSPLPVKVFLIFVGLFITAAIASSVGVSTGITLLLATATAAGLSAMAFLRRERPASDFVPQP